MLEPEKQGDEYQWPRYKAVDEEPNTGDGCNLRFGKRSVISPMIIPFNTQLKIDVQIGTGSYLTLKGKICRCQRAPGGWKAEVFFISNI